MCQCRFIDCNKCATLVGDVDNGVGHVCVSTGDTWEISVPQFCCEPKMFFKNSLKKEHITIYISTQKYSGVKIKYLQDLHEGGPQKPRIIFWRSGPL